ncbi:SprB repeat-containing protein, partial [Crocinitomix algicola]|uniref:SprB repeat-containing protein n=1 Tax=Crocinitomix algicola TaxID=1740263 RepID=UPI001586B3E0
MMQIIRFCFGIAIITVASLIHNDASASILNVPFHTANVDFESVECVNVTDAGEIGFNQTNVGAFIPETISSLSPATGGIGPVEYVWIKRTPDVFSWTLIPGANEEEYSPGLITETTIFRRCARNVGCEDFEGVSNDITITITEPDPLDVDEFNDCSVDGGIEYDVQIEGMEDYIDPCMTVEDTSGMLSMYVEVWLQNTDCGWHILPSSIEIEVDGTVYTAPGVIAEQTSPGGSIEKIYRVLVPGVSESICVVDAGYCDILSTALYIKRLSDENSSSSFKTFNRELHYTHSAWGTDDCVTDILLVGESLISRDIDLYIPIHEKDDVRTVRIDVEVTNDEGIVVATYSESFTEQNAGNEASLYAITVPDVPGDGTNIELTVCSPHGSGDSFGVGAVALTTAGGCVTCEMAEIKFIKSNPTCEEIDGGAITASILDGTAPFTYLWSDGQTTQTAVGLSAGTYTVTVTDANGCVMEGSKTLSAPPCCNVTNAGEIGDNQENCGPFDPDLLFSIEPASGGIGPVEYQWIKSDTLTIPYEDDPYWSPIPGANGPTYDPGVITESTYFVRCARNEGCDFFAGESNTISIIVHPEYELTVAEEHVVCKGSSTGSATVSVLGGTAPYTYLWSNGETAATAADLTAGVYTVTVTDANGCESTAEVEITEPAAALTSSITAESIACFGGTSSATVSAVGGTAPYTYLWSNGETAATATDLTAGVYTVTVTDAN